MRKSVMLYLLVWIVSLFLVGCSVQPRDHGAMIEDFLKAKTRLFERREEILQALGKTKEDVIDIEKMLPLEKNKQEALDEVFKDIRFLLTREEYVRLFENLDIVDNELLSGKYDKLELKNLYYERVDVNADRMIYRVNYTARFLREKKGVIEEDVTREFVFQNVENDWLISHIH